MDGKLQVRQPQTDPPDSRASLEMRPGDHPRPDRFPNRDLGRSAPSAPAPGRP